LRQVVECDGKRRYAIEDGRIHAGQGHSVPVVAAGAMHADGHPFRPSANGFWLVDHAPPGRLRLPS
jgi:RNA:NAD 2'-phosphotransferase (TPT1/KptA family)